MKQEFLAKQDTNRRAGDILIAAAAGEKVRLSDREAAAAIHFDELEYVGIVPETNAETVFDQSQITQNETKEDLEKNHKRDELAEMATSLGIAVNSDTKAEIAAAIVAKREENALKTLSPDFDQKESE